MNAKDGSSSNLENSNEEKKDKKENIENEDENTRRGSGDKDGCDRL